MTGGRDWNTCFLVLLCPAGSLLVVVVAAASAAVYHPPAVCLALYRGCNVKEELIV